MTTNQSPQTSPAASSPGGSKPWLLRPRWNPYLVGAMIGALSILAFAVPGKPIGMSTALSEVSGQCAIPILGEQTVASNAYWTRYKPQWNYGIAFLAATFGGALISAIASRSFKPETVPQVWQERFGKGPLSGLARLVVAFVGGILAMYGARMAGGCTSGHGISGSLQLAVSSWTFFLVMFAAGIITALAVFGLGRNKA